MRARGVRGAPKAATHRFFRARIRAWDPRAWAVMRGDLGLARDMGRVMRAMTSPPGEAVRVGLGRGRGDAIRTRTKPTAVPSGKRIIPPMGRITVYVKDNWCVDWVCAPVCYAVWVPGPPPALPWAAAVPNVIVEPF